MHAASYYVAVALLIFAMLGAWCTTLFALPGNWINVGLAAVFALLFPPGQGHGIGWKIVGASALLAIAGEAIEIIAGAAGARRAGASGRGIALAIVGTMVGSIAGAIVGVPIPVVGVFVGALAGGALGAFIGAFLGEEWKGSETSQSLAAAKGALVGRLFGTVGKLAAGAAIIVIVAVDAIW
jgi:uncharacterized protein